MRYMYLERLTFTSTIRDAVSSRDVNDRKDIFLSTYYDLHLIQNLTMFCVFAKSEKSGVDVDFVFALE